jgi:hypothetical protein
MAAQPRILAPSCALLLAGCIAAGAPPAELKALRSAYDEVRAASLPLLDELGAAERRHSLAQREAAARRSGDYRVIGALGFLDRFAAEDAALHATIAEPPATATLRHGLALVGGYVELLTLLAAGGDVAAARAEIGLLLAHLRAIALLMPGGEGAAAAAGRAAPVLEAVLGRALEAGNAAKLRRIVLEGGPQLRRLIAALRAAAPAMFDLIAAGAAEIAVTRGPRDPEIARAAIRSIEARRVAVANYAILLERLDDGLERLIAAVAQPADRARLAVLATSAAQLARDAVTMRRALTADRLAAAPAAPTIP